MVHAEAEDLLGEGRIRAIGVCNYNTEHLAELMKRTDVVPAVNQVELHPYFVQQEVRSADAAHGIVTRSWSPFDRARPVADPEIRQGPPRTGKPERLRLRARPQGDGRHRRTRQRRSSLASEKH
ncbi:aldo/keto reductase [Streptomyces sp. NPDC090088]|uniref:aldo/keto reductase n=1 Tax=Streptomyces sp. NPDC090088 TaxID=3365944 RepID=UPI00381E8802